MRSIFNPLTHDGAYVLGLICSDGRVVNNTIEITQEKDAGNDLFHISRVLFGTEDAIRQGSQTLKLIIDDNGFAEHVLSFGQKNTRGYLILSPESPIFRHKDKKWSFICGYFDGRAGQFQYNDKHPRIRVFGRSHKLMEDISTYWNVPYNGKHTLSASGYKALDICGKMYENVSFRQSKKYDDFMDILNWEPFPNGPWFRDHYFKCKKLDKNARIPSKKRVTDSGYDIHAITLDYDETSGLFTADTRLAVEPIPGYYFDMVGRSSLPSFGFCFVGGVGIIDRSYVGSLKMKLLKFDQTAPVPALPFRCGQIIPRKIIHLDFVEVDELNDSDRGAGGFGSTNDDAIGK